MYDALIYNVLRLERIARCSVVFPLVTVADATGLNRQTTGVSLARILRARRAACLNDYKER